jgi:hypothetical protein
VEKDELPISVVRWQQGSRICFPEFCFVNANESNTTEDQKKMHKFEIHRIIKLLMDIRQKK